MATYEIRIASGMNLQQVAFLGAKFSSTDLLMDIILENPSREASNSMESRRALAKHRYNWALSTSPFGSDILVANKLHTPHLIEASAWVQYFGPDMAWGVPWSDEPGTFQLPPDCANARLYRFIENALQTDRKVFMRGRCHYYIHQLDFNVFEQTSSSKEAARYLLSHISRIDPQVDKYAHFRIAHHDILQGLGWMFLGGLDIRPMVPDNGEAVTVPRCREKWLLRGVLDSAETAVAVDASNPYSASKPNSARSTRSTSGNILG